MSSRAVQETSDLDRILALPKRQGSSVDLVEALSTYLRKPHTCTEACSITRLLPLQAQALIEAHDRGGLFLQAPIGAGKSLCSYLLPAVFNAKRPLLIVPGGAIMDQTVQSIKDLRHHWDIRPVVLQSYQFLAQASNVDYLEQYNPDLIVADEVHRSKDPKRSVARRLRRFLKTHPEVPFCAMSGTPAKRSVKDFAPAMHYAMGDQSPLPLRESDLLDWSLVLDAGLRDDQRIGPGALARWYGTNIQDIRRGVRDRIFSTPGCIASDVANVTAKLEITLRNVPLSAAEDQCYKKLYEDMETPDGHAFFDAIDLWRYARQLAMGFFGRWDPPAPKDWLEARKEWYAVCREILSHSRRLDTEKQVALHIDAHPDHHATEVLARWRALKDAFVPNSVPVWTGSTALEYAATWLQGGGVVWTEHVAVGERLAVMTGMPYFGAGGLDAMGHSIVHYQGSGLIASIQANGTGLNLQRYSRGLITSMTPTATHWDQTMGRMHRQGQTADVVTFDAPISCREQLAGFERAANDDAAFHHDLLGIPGKLLGQPTHAEKFLQNGFAWGTVQR